LDLESRFPNPENRCAITYLKERAPSAHGDLAEQLSTAAAGLQECELYCPSPGEFSYCMLHSRSGVIFALALGMRHLSFRLAPDDIPKAIASGGQAQPELGAGWVAFEAFSGARPVAEVVSELRSWCGCAYRLAVRPQGKTSE
jgi:hypothetical protein